MGIDERFGGDMSVGAWNVDVSANAPVTQDGQLANIIPVTLR